MGVSAESMRDPRRSEGRDPRPEARIPGADAAERTDQPHPDQPHPDQLQAEAASQAVRDAAQRLAEHGSAAELEALLERFEEVPVAEHAALYDQLHRALRTHLDAEPSPASGAPGPARADREPRG